MLVSLLWIAVSTTTTYFLHRLDHAYTQVLYDDREIVRAASTIQGLLWSAQASVIAAAEDGRRLQSDELALPESAFRDALAEATLAAAGKLEPELVTEIGVRFSIYMNFLRTQATQAEAAANIDGPVAQPAPDRRKCSSTRPMRPKPWIWPWVSTSRASDCSILASNW